MTFNSLGRPPASPAIFPPWPAELISSVERALQESWRALLRHYPHVLTTLDEDKITEALVDIMIDFRKRASVQGFTPAFFGVPTRDAKHRDWTGKWIDQMPDIKVPLALPRSNVAHDNHDAMFFECKVLFGKRQLRLYGDDGMERFVDGRYGWCMPHGHMVAYVLKAPSDQPHPALTTHFARARGKPPRTNGKRLAVHGTPTVVKPAVCSNTRDIVETEHLRAAPVLASGQNKIILRHLWLCI